ncbi:xanthomonadin biosynthesis protein, partial [Xanthomonas campestris pv. raphani]|uniref:xanthomonadin biosynthesis protein n=1 Tax=Xanthomonas campestris TaxID=339 RepID=UPI0039C28708
MVQPCSPALPPGPSLPQLAGWSLPSDAAARDATEAHCTERSAGTTCQGEAPNLPQP